jgi:hypothetical protein
MKKEYEKPQIEIIVLEEEITAGSFSMNNEADILTCYSN